MALEIKTEKAGKATWTVFQAEFSEPLPFTIRLFPQTFFSNLGNTLHNRVDIETGDPTFDSAVVVLSDDVEQLRDFLDERARKAILTIRAQFDLFELTQDGIETKRKSLIFNEAELISNIQLLEKSVRKIWESAIEDATPAPIPPPLPSKRKTIVEVKSDPVEPEAAPEEPERSVVPLPEPGMIEEAHAERVNLEEESPLPETPEEIVSPEPEETPFEIAEEVSDSEFANRCVEILSECQGRYATKKTFDEELKGEEIVATLPLIRADSFFMDKHFGRGPGVLRTFTLGRLSNGEELLLVADTGEDRSLADVRSRTGESDTVLGTLISFDPFSHTIFLRSSYSEDDE